MKVCVVGSGPSGMMAAYQAALYGCDVDILDRNEKPGKKLYITGKGRCNVTNLCSKDEFFSNIISNAKFMYSSFSEFSNYDTFDFIESFGTQLKVERGNRVFPISDKASDITRALTRACESVHVKWKYNCEVENIIKNDNGYDIITKNFVLKYDKVIVAMGGSSYRATGSTGDGFAIAKRLGHTITDIKPALVPLKLGNKDISDVEGVSLKNVKLLVEVNNRTIEQFGEMLFCHDGISGPIVLSMSSLINRFNAKDIKMWIDFKSVLDKEQLILRLDREIESAGSKEVFSIIRNLLPGKLAPYFLKSINLSKSIKSSKITKEQKLTIVDNLKRFELKFISLYPLDCAIITSGGVSTKNINPKTMESLICPNLYFCGEVIDIDALTGGFNIQLALSTGFSAGKYCALGGKK